MGGAEGEATVDEGALLIDSPEAGDPAVGQDTADPDLVPMIGLSAVALSAVEASIADNAYPAYTSDWARFESFCTAEGQVALPTV